MTSLSGCGDAAEHTILGGTPRCILKERKRNDKKEDRNDSLSALESLQRYVKKTFVWIQVLRLRHTDYAILMQIGAAHALSHSIIIHIL